jgi:hypothetical protein
MIVALNIDLVICREARPIARGRTSALKQIPGSTSIPGYAREAWGPFFIELLSQNKRLLQTHNLLNEEKKARIERLEHKLQILNGGGTLP